MTTIRSWIHGDPAAPVLDERDLGATVSTGFAHGLLLTSRSSTISWPGREREPARDLPTRSRSSRSLTMTRSVAGRPWSLIRRRSQARLVSGLCRSPSSRSSRPGARVTRSPGSRSSVAGGKEAVRESRLRSLLQRSRPKKRPRRFVAERGLVLYACYARRVNNPSVAPRPPPPRGRRSRGPGRPRP